VLSEGAAAPRFELPALVDGEQRRVALSEYLGEDIVILAFYPGDFNPACDAESCDLDELDLFTMQKDVTILGISPDSVYSHRAFARQYDLKVPLLADTDGTVAAKYGVDLVDDLGQRLVERAVVVVDHDGTVAYTWSTDDMTTLPPVEEIKDALAEAGGDDTAFARYRVGHAHYTEGRRAFTSAMQSFGDTEWMLAQHDFRQAREEFEAAADRFDTAIRFVDDESLVAVYEGANEKATALWQAADWLADSASAYSSGSGTEGQKLRDDAEIPLSTVREYAEPPDPDEWPPDVDSLEKDEPADHSILPTEPDAEDAALDVDIDAAVGDGDDASAGDDGDATPADAESAADATGDEVAASTAAADADDPDDDIDDAELAEIQAELVANNPESEPSVEAVTEESTAIVEAPPMSDAESDDEAADGVEDDTAADERTADQLSDTGETDDGADADETADPETADSVADEGRADPETADHSAPVADCEPTADADEAGGEATDESAGHDELDLQLELVESDPPSLDDRGKESADESGPDGETFELQDPEEPATDE
jgi:peroxiredoxin